MEDSVFLIISLTIVWTIISAIVGGFGKSRKIGFAGAFLASFFLSPILAMLFILASDKTSGGKLSKGEKWLIATPIILIIGFFCVPKIEEANQNIRWHNEKMLIAKEELNKLNSFTSANLEMDIESKDIYQISNKVGRGRFITVYDTIYHFPISDDFQKRMHLISHNTEHYSPQRLVEITGFDTDLEFKTIAEFNRIKNNAIVSRNTTIIEESNISNSFLGWKKILN